MARWIHALVATGIGLSVMMGAPARALERQHFALEIPLKLPAGAALVSVDLPVEVYLASRRGALADLRIVNGAGEAVPFALGAPRPTAETPVATALAVLPYFAQASNASRAADQISLTRQGDQLQLTIGPTAQAGEGRVLQAYYVDLGAAPGDKPTQRLQSLELKLAGDADVNASLRIEGSADLQRWQPLQEAGPVFRLSHGGQQLSRLRLDLLPEPVRYLRLSAVAGSRLPELAGVAVQATAQPLLAPLLWVTAKGTAAPAPARNALRYDLGIAVPVSRINLDFADGNTLAPVVIEARNDEKGPWQELRRATLYRLNASAGEVRNADLMLGGTGAWRYWQVQIDERAGEFAQRPPALRLGLHAARIAFVARGAPPFALLIGNAQAESVALSPESLPGVGAEWMSQAQRDAQLEMAQALRRPGLGPLVIDEGPAQRRKWILWAAIIVGVLALAFVAARLLREPPK